MVTVVVGTKGENIQHDYPSNVRVSSKDSNLPIETVFLCFQFRSLDPNRFPEMPVGKLSSDIMQQVDAAIRYCLSL